MQLKTFKKPTYIRGDYKTPQRSPSRAKKKKTVNINDLSKSGFSRLPRTRTPVKAHHKSPRKHKRLELILGVDEKTLLKKRRSNLFNHSQDFKKTPASPRMARKSMNLGRKSPNRLSRPKHYSYKKAKKLDSEFAAVAGLPTKGQENRRRVIRDLNLNKKFKTTRMRLSQNFLDSRKNSKNEDKNQAKRNVRQSINAQTSGVFARKVGNVSTSKFTLSEDFEEDLILRPRNDSQKQESGGGAARAPPGLRSSKSEVFGRNVRQSMDLPLKNKKFGRMGGRGGAKPVIFDRARKSDAGRLKSVLSNRRNVSNGPQNPKNWKNKIRKKSRKRNEKSRSRSRSKSPGGRKDTSATATSSRRASRSPNRSISTNRQNSQNRENRLLGKKYRTTLKYLKLSRKLEVGKNYYSADLVNYFHSSKGSVKKFCDHFTDMFKVIKSARKFKPLRSYDIVKKGVKLRGLDPTKKILILDMDETLVHVEFVFQRRNDTVRMEIEPKKWFNVKISKRPFMGDFLKDMNQYFNLVLFTASQRTYGEKILNRIDPDGLLKWRFYRDTCVETKNNVSTKPQKQSKIHKF